jgi:hypothetical protein
LHYFRRAFDIPIAIFMGTALVGVWAAYQRQAAWEKFWWILAAVILYYVLARQRRNKIWPVVGLITVFGFLLSGYFLLTYSWIDQPVKIGLVNRIARVWMSIRPGLPYPPPDSDITAGVLAILLPLPLALGAYGWREARWKSWRLLLLAGLAGLTTLLALFLAAERAPWLALIPAGAVWLWWELCFPLARRFHWSQQAIFVVGMVIVIFIGLGLVLATPGSVKNLADRLPGPAEADSRTTLWANSIKLVGDYPITGMGLQSFPGQYSQYILVIPFYYVDNSHNLFLEIALEQGVLGLLALVVIIVGSVWLLIFSRSEGGISPEKDRLRTLRGALLAGLTILVAQGLVENALYSTWDVLFLFLLPGLVIATTQVVTRQANSARYIRIQKVALVGGIAIILLALVGFWRPILATFYANLGAVEMARIDLKDFPSGAWGEKVDLARLTSVENLFQRALQVNPLNRTVFHRTGLIAMQQDDFASAIYWLKQAFLLDSADRGVRKELGYCYAWVGQFDEAVRILESIPEASSEMDVYSRWWLEQGRPDLATNAQRVCQMLTQNFQGKD